MPKETDQGAMLVAVSGIPRVQVSGTPTVEVTQGAVRATVTDVDIKFGTMVWLMIKASFAAAIAFAVTSVIWLGLAAAFTTVLAGIGASLTM